VVVDMLVYVLLQLRKLLLQKGNREPRKTCKSGIIVAKKPA
jgi:hypothetical protein